MDPNACYQKWLRNAKVSLDRDASPTDRREAVDTAIEAAQDLTDWIGKGGFLPKDLQNPENMAGFQAWCDDYLGEPNLVSYEMS